MKFREFLGSVITSIGMLILRVGVTITNAGFDLSEVNRENVVKLMSQLWQKEEVKWKPQVVKHDDIVNRPDPIFVRAETRIETGSHG